MSNSSIWPIDRTLSVANTPDQSGPESDGNEGVLCIPQSSSINGASPLDCLVSYQGLSLEEFYPSAEMRSVYSAVLADRVKSQRIFTGREHTLKLIGWVKFGKNLDYLLRIVVWDECFYHLSHVYSFFMFKKRKKIYSISDTFWVFFPVMWLKFWGKNTCETRERERFELNWKRGRNGERKVEMKKKLKDRKQEEWKYRERKEKKKNLKGGTDLI